MYVHEKYLALCYNYDDWLRSRGRTPSTTTTTGLGTRGGHRGAAGSGGERTKEGRDWGREKLYEDE